MIIEMRRVTVSFIISMLFYVHVYAQEDMEVQAISAILGVSDIEETDQYEVERLSVLLDRPLKLNSASATRLVSSGLFTNYQAASVLDYRKRHGDILSFAELSLLDGFSEEYVRIIKPFIDVSDGELYDLSYSGFNHELRIRTGIRPGESGQWNYAVKYEFESSHSVAAGLSVSRPSSISGILPDLFSAGVEYEPRKIPVRFIAGDYNARFGQGLAFWNGMPMSGLSSPSTFMRRPSGFSRSSSFTGNYAMTGAAASLFVRRLVFNASIAFPGIKTFHASPEKISILPIMNLIWNFRNGQLGATHYADFRNDIHDMKTSIDMAWCISGVDVFAELVYDWVSRVPAGLAGFDFPVGESFRGAVMLRAYPPAFNSERSGAQRSTTKCSDEYSFSLAGEYVSPDRSHSITLSSDIARFPEPKTKTSDEDFQLKVSAGWQWSEDDFFIRIRLNERVRSWGAFNRTDFRADVSLPLQRLVLNIRANLLYCKSMAGLIYGEVGHDGKSVASYFRAGIFCVDNWDDRIYVYERDAPGGFNVPAMYGRGLWSAATISWKPSRWLKLYARSSFTTYPFMDVEKKKPGRAELKLQCVFSF